MSTNKQAQAIISDIKLKHGSGDVYAPIIRWDEFQSITGALEAAESRIAELEAREIVLPQRQEPTSSGHYGEGYLVPSNAGSALDYEDTVEAIRAAGITVKGE